MIRMLSMDLILYVVAWQLSSKEVSAKISTEKPCTYSPYSDGCGNRVWFWDCSHRNLTKIPTDIPQKYKNSFLALKFSENRITDISRATFQRIQPEFRSHITALYFRGNRLRSIENFSFQSLYRLCEMDLSNCFLSKKTLSSRAFAKLHHLKVLRLHRNKFQIGGYPDVALSKLLTLETLTMDVFEGFYFSLLFWNLKRLRNVEFFTGISKFHLTNSTFTGLSHSPISYLDLKFQHFVHCDVSENIFCSFPALKGVHIEFGGMCDLNTALKSLKCLQNRTMEYIEAYENEPIFVTRSVFLNEENCKYLFRICSKTVNLSNNGIAGISYNPVKTVMGQCVENLNMSLNLITAMYPTYVFDFLTQYPNLQVLDVSCNYDCLQDFVFLVYGNFPQMQNMFLNYSFSAQTRNGSVTQTFDSSHFRKKPIITFILSKTLKVIKLSNNRFKDLPGLPFRFTFDAENLTEVYLRHNNLPCLYIAPLKTRSLEILDISLNECSEMDSNLLKFTLKMKKFVASASNLNFNDTNNIGKGTIFHGLKSLQEVDLSGNEIFNLPSTTFKDQRYSLLSLNLDRNWISTVPVSNLKNLYLLYLRYNKISFISEGAIKNVMSMSKAKIFIEGNPIDCECTHISSLKWIRENQHKFEDLNATFCIDNKEMSITKFLQKETFVQFELRCQTKSWLIASSITFLLVIAVVLITVVVKQYQVHVDYVILRIRSRWRGVMRMGHSEQFLFDAFVSYAEEDYEQVCNTLYQVLTCRGFKISLPDKDFIPGFSQMEQLLQCIDDSRKVVFLVTEKFLQSGWNSYTVQMVATHAIHNHRERSIIVIIKDDIPIERMPRDLKLIWWSIISIRWPKYEENMDDFLKEITTALRPDR